MSGWILLGLVVLAWWCLSSGSSKSKSSMRPTVHRVGGVAGREHVIVHEAEGHAAAAIALGATRVECEVLSDHSGVTRVWGLDAVDSATVAIAGEEAANRYRFWTRDTTEDDACIAHAKLAGSGVSFGEAKRRAKQVLNTGAARRAGREAAAGLRRHGRYSA